MIPILMHMYLLPHTSTPRIDVMECYHIRLIPYALKTFYLYTIYYSHYEHATYVYRPIET